MRFKEWMAVVSEMGEIKRANTSGVDLTKTDDGYASSFKIDGKSYTVGMSRDTSGSANYMERPVPDTYNIWLKSAATGYAATGSSDYTGTSIYTQMLLALKKFMGTVPVSGLVFSPYEPRMALVYDMFYKSFLKNDFTRVTSVLYLKNDYLQKAHAGLSPEQLQKQQQNIDGEQAAAKARLNDIRRAKAAQRNVKPVEKPVTYGNTDSFDPNRYVDRPDDW